MEHQECFNRCAGFPKCICGDENARRIADLERYQRATLPCTDAVGRGAKVKTLTEWYAEKYPEGKDVVSDCSKQGSAVDVGLRRFLHVLTNYLDYVAGELK